MQRKGAGTARRPPLIEKKDNASASKSRPESKSSGDSMASQREQSSSRLWYWLYVAMVLASPMVINHAAIVKEQRMLIPSEGEMVEITKGQRLFLRCQGEGSPVVILESPVGTTTDVWRFVQRSVSKVTKVCSYDRAGLGFSDRPFVNQSTKDLPTKRGQAYTAERMVDDFYRLFVLQSGLSSPFVLVGAELGALVARFSTQLFEGVVAGLVLVDPMVEGVFDLEQQLFKKHWFDDRLASWQKQQVLAATGLARISLILGLHDIKSNNKKLDADEEARHKHLLCKPAHWQSAVEELILANESVSQLRLVWRIKSFPRNVSVSVLTSDVYDSRLGAAVNRVWRSSQDHLLKVLHPNCLHRRLAGGSGRRMLTENADAVRESIIEMVKNVRASSKESDGKTINKAEMNMNVKSGQRHLHSTVVLPPRPNKNAH